MEVKSQRIFVAGATGYLGQFIVQEALKCGYSVRALTRNKSRLPPNLTQIPQGDNFEVVEGEATKLETLQGLTKGCDILFSSIGITKQQDKDVKYMDVDYGANRNLLDEAKESGSVNRFIYTHVLNPEKLLHVELIAAKHRFVSELKKEFEETKNIQPCIIYPSGFYSDLEEILTMALSGRVYIMGDGKELVSPIWGQDLAHVVISALDQGNTDIPIGGPETLSFMKIAKLAKQAVEKGYAGEQDSRKVEISSVPRWMVNAVVWIITKVTNQKIYGPVHFISEASKHDMSAPNFGAKKLLDFYCDKVDEHNKNQAEAKK